MSKSSLSTAEAAELLGVSVRTLYRWEKSGKIKPIRTPGGHRRYDVADLITTKNDASLTLAVAQELK